MSGGTPWSPERRLLTVGLLGLVTAAAFEGMAVPTVLPATVDDLGGLGLYGWAFSAFWLTNLIGIALGGADADRRGPARAFLVGAALFAAGVVVSGVAPDMTVVIAGRAIQGFGSGAISAVVYVTIARAYAPSSIPKMIALLSSAWVVPGLVGPALAGVVADSIGWRWVFLGIVPPVVAMTAAVLPRLRPLGVDRRRAPGPRSDRRRAFDAVQLAAGSTMALGALTVGQPIPAVALGLPGALLAILALRHLLPPGALVLRRGRPAVVTIVFGLTFAFFGTEAFIPLAVSTVRGAGIVVGGLALSAAAVSWASGSWLQARWTRGGRRRPLVWSGAGLIAIGIGITAIVLLPEAPVAVAAFGWAVAGLGMGLSYSTLSLLVLETAEPGQEGASSAALQLMFTLGTAFGAGVGGAVIALSESTALLGLAPAIGIAFAIAALLALAVVGFSPRVPADAVERPSAPAPAAPPA